MKIPKPFLDEFLNKSKGFTMFGVLLEDMTKEELMACVVAGWEAEKKAIDRQSIIYNI
tara:strand:- start:1170 stop:1343 length:174 start_codon:yes stop_codon:yes gene_type:complete